MNSLKILKLVLVITLCLKGLVNAQVGVGTVSPDASSILDLTSTSKGLLAPRLTTAQKIALPSPATGLLIYQTDGAAGFWYYNGTSWISLLSEMTGWTVTGNSETVDGTNFIGTKDNIPFNIKVNNQKAGRIDNTLENAFYGYQAGNSATTGSQNVFMGNRAGYSSTTGGKNVFIGDSAGFSATNPLWLVGIGYRALYNNTANNLVAVGYRALEANTGAANTAIGNSSLYLNTSGAGNTALGSGSLTNNITGSQNTASGWNSLSRESTGSGNSAFGGQAMFNDTSGSYNCAFGFNSLLASRNASYNSAFGYEALRGTATGGYNIGIGLRAGYSNTTGSNNIFIGDSANATSTGWSNATAIGYTAKVGASNSMVFGDSLTAHTVNVGICYPTPNAKLHVNGDLLLTPDNNTASSGTLNDYARSGKTILYFSNATAKTLTGIGTPFDGMVLYITNSGGNLVINNNSASSAAANRIITGSGGNVTITGDGGATLIYTGSYWRIVALVL